MAKRQLTASEAFGLRQALHVATLDALMASRRWEPGDLIFQGGTSLHLTHGSPRYSEDLDFLVNSSLKLGAIGDAIQARLAGTASPVISSDGCHRPGRWTRPTLAASTRPQNRPWSSCTNPGGTP
jgi:hypothetical protein